MLFHVLTFLENHLFGSAHVFSLSATNPEKHNQRQGQPKIGRSTVDTTDNGSTIVALIWQSPLGVCYYSAALKVHFLDRDVISSVLSE